MTWTSITDLATGDKVTETIWDDQVKGNLEHLYAKFDTGFIWENAATELTIASGVITVTAPLHTIDTESDAASDDLDTINGGTAQEEILLVAANTARTVVMKHGTGNIRTPDGNDISLDSTDKYVRLFYDGSNWFVVGGTGAGGSADWASPGAIGSATPNTGVFTKLNFSADTELTISSGAVTVTQSFHTIDTEADAASDTLTTINGGSEGMWLVIRAENAARTVIVDHGGGNINLITGEDFNLADTSEALLLFYDAALTTWFGVPLGQTTTNTWSVAKVKTGADQGALLSTVTGFTIGYDDSGTVRDLLGFNRNASGVNYLEIDDAAAGSNPILSAAGSDTNVDLRLEGKGDGDPSVPALKIGDDGDLDNAAIEKAEASATLSGASTDIQVNIPDDSLIIGVVVSATTDVYVDDSPGAWDAAFTGGNSSAIVTGAASADQNLKKPITSGETTAETDVRCTPNAGSAFTAGVVKATVFYWSFGDNVGA